MIPAAFLFLLAQPAPAPQEVVPLGALDLVHLEQGWGRPRVDRSVEDTPLRIGGRTFAHGVGSHASSRLHVALDGGALRFRAWVGVDDETAGRGSVAFRVYGDERRLFDSGVRRGGEPALRVDLDLRGIERLLLVTTGGDDGIDYDHANWAEAEFVTDGATPRAVAPPAEEERPLLTPPPGPAPAIHGPDLAGARPGRPFLWRIPCTGERPLAFAAEGLPPGLTLDAERGILDGRAPAAPGEYAILLRARNRHGEAARAFRLVVGERLALTPPMGWNSWYIHYDRVSDAGARAAAEAMLASGMADFGYRYVNLDDCWMQRHGDEPARDADGAVLPNERFPDMSALAAYIHSLGLLAGLYTSPGPWTCAGYEGAFGHEEADARRFAEWGFDFLKYDWCSYGEVATGEGRERLVLPYRKMAAILRDLDRDLVFNLCQYGMGEVWTWGAAAGGHSWRTTGDLGLERGGALPGFYTIGLRNAALAEHAGPGGWNDPDYLLLGWVGDATRMGEGQPTTLTAHEQYSCMSMWCLMAAPLIFSGDMTRLDPFTLNVLCNAEVLAVDQDALGRQGRILRHADDVLVLVKPLADGTLAAGLFNLDEVPRQIDLSWAELGRSGPQQVRDLWRQRPLGTFADGISLKVPRHGVALLRLATGE